MPVTAAVLKLTFDAAISDLILRADLPGDGVVDALNLLANVVIHRISEDPAASVDTVIAAAYADATPDEVISWFA